MMDWYDSFLISFCIFIVGILVFIAYACEQTDTQRKANFNNIDNATNCNSLAKSYLKAVDFESEYHNNGYLETVKIHTQIRSNELGCK